MASLYLARLSATDRANLVQKLHDSQNGNCFICEEPIDLALHRDSIDIDHIIPLKMNGPDNPNNFGLTHSSCNRSKQASDLNIAKILCKFDKLRENISSANRGPNLNDVLNLYFGAKNKLSILIENNKIKYSFPEIGENAVQESIIYKDNLSGFTYFFAVLPIEYIHHDDKINPRSIGANISKLIQEFYLRRPQLHISLGWLETTSSNVYIKIFDGQHKAAAQVLLGTRYLPVRIFIDPNIDILLTANTNAGTFLKQVAFDKSVQRHLGSALYIDRVEQYIKDHNIPENDFSFSERDLMKHFKGESREMKKYILDSIRDTITHNIDNKLKDYIDFGGRGKEKPLSYSTIEKTFYSFFIFQEVLDTPLNYLLEEGENPRELEKQQIMQLMNVIAEIVYIGKFDFDIGTSQIENKIQKGENIPSGHLIAYRMSKEEIIYNWLKCIEQIIKNYFTMHSSKYYNEKKLFQYKFPETLWGKIEIFTKNLSILPVWINKDLSNTVFGGKQNNDFWQTIFEKGKSPQGLQVLAEPINLMKMIMENEMT
jgi:hypothetical protein